MKLVKFIKYYSKFKAKLPTIQTNERDLIESFSNQDTDFDFINRWNVPLLKKKVKIKNMIIINSILLCIIIYLIVK